MQKIWESWQRDELQDVRGLIETFEKLGRKYWSDHELSALIQENLKSFRDKEAFLERSILNGNFANA